MHAFNLEQPTKRETLHILMDSGSQSSYITSRACRALSLRKLGTKPVSIMSFGSKRERHERCSVVHVGVETRDHKHIELKLLSVEHICEPISNNTLGHIYELITNSKLDFNRYPYLKRLDLAFVT